MFAKYQSARPKLAPNLSKRALSAAVFLVGLAAACYFLNESLKPTVPDGLNDVAEFYMGSFYTYMPRYVHFAGFVGGIAIAYAGLRLATKINKKEG